MPRKNSDKTVASGQKPTSERISLDKLTLDPANTRKHSARNIDTIKASLTRFGQQHPIIVNRDGVVLAGNGRLQAMRYMGWKDCLVMRTDLVGSDAAAFSIADNRTAELAEWDDDALAQTLASLQNDEDYDHLVAGFSDEEIADLITEVSMGDGGEIVEDEVPEPPAEPTTKTGDLWILGGHRLLCGDSTNADDVARVIDKNTVVCCITDPPYSVNYDKSQEQRGGDKNVHGAYKEVDIDPPDLLRFIAHVPCDVMVWSYPIDRHFYALAKAYDDYGWVFKKELIWVKDSFSFWMSAKYQQNHEPIMLAVKKGKPIGGNVPSNATTAMHFPRPKAHKLHPTAKPIELWSVFVTNHSDVGDGVYEPFMGSGTTLIAAEQLGRKCYGIEISPAYCDVIVKRWENLTGEKAVLDGQ